MRRRTSRDRDAERDFTMGEGPDVSTRLSRIERMLMELIRRSGIEMEMRFEQMADFSPLLASITKMQGKVDSANALVAGLQKQLADLAKDMSDEEDQKKIAEYAASLDALHDTLAPAIEANDPGGSLGGITKQTE